MARNMGMGILRMVALIGGVGMLLFVVLTAGVTLLPGTKVRRLFGATAESLAGNGEPRRVGDFNTSTTREPAAAASAALTADAGIDAGTLAAAPGGQGVVAPAGEVLAQPPPEEQGR